MLLCWCASASPALAQDASTWFLAEGVSNGTFDQDILIGNPAPGSVSVTITLLPAPDALLTGENPRTFTVPGTGRLTVNLKQAFPGLNGAASAEVSAVVAGTSTPADIVVERSVFFPLTGTPYAGGTSASGVTEPATRWILAEGSGGVFDTFILLANPGASATATVSVRYLRGNGTTVTETRTIAPGRRDTLWPSILPGLATEGFTTVVESNVPIVAERAMYFDNFRSGHGALGATQARSTWFFAEGFTGGNASIAFETFLLIGNDNALPAAVTVTYFRDAGTPLVKTYHVPARSRFNIWTDQEPADGGGRLLPNTAFSVRIDSDRPIVAERAMYWGTPSAADPTTPVFPWAEGHAVGGIEAPALKWAFAEGRQGLDRSGVTFDSFFLVVNPHPSAIQVKATFATEDGTGVSTTVTVPANARTNIWPAAGLAEFQLLQGRRFAVFLEAVGGSPLPFVAERATYWNGYIGGHANAGTPWTGTFSTPAQQPANVQVTSMTPGAGRLSGGNVVTINGAGFGGATEVFFGGARVLPTSVTANAITFTVPLRTESTGYGTPGPRAVSLLSNGRYAPVSTYTQYFTVLAFGDSLTWGTTNFYVGDVKMSVTVNRPYPRRVRDLLRANPRFGEYVLLTNAGVPGERAVGEGDVRIKRCINGQANCLFTAAPGPDPYDYLTPYDAVVLLEGVNDINGPTTPARVRDSLRLMTVDAKATGARVLLTRFDSYGYNTVTGQPAVDTLEEAEELGDLTFALAVEQNTMRSRFEGISMDDGGLHPTQAGYDQMGATAASKLAEEFPRCAAGAPSCP